MVLKGDLTTVSTEVVVEKLSARLEGEKEGAPVQFPPDRRPAKPLADASCCASMQRSGGEKLVYLWPDEYFAGFTFTFLFKVYFINLWLPLTSLSWKGGDGKGNN